ncbi:hypothetical protein MTR67_022171 [Solanum verrucosum]|uniref:Uncharacterized protein n=1 Tax=Solanum verrucosum TaxID=315347 RepID=A0AAF0QSW2_SOLVR|nr:hypothetical protein MTR67_022171 [Solanum verrucosum]
MIRHNLDVMHIEKNVFDNVFNTVLEVDGKTKDNPKARLDVVKYCNRPHLARNPDGSYPKAAYTINKDKKKALTELSLFFKDLTSTTLRVVDLERLECTFHMKHELLDLYNIDGCSLLRESTQLFSHYFEPHVMTRHHNVIRNDDGGAMKDVEGNLSIFTHPSRLSGEGKKRDLSLEEIKAAQTYILLNCQEVERFVR